MISVNPKKRKRGEVDLDGDGWLGSLIPKHGLRLTLGDFFHADVPVVCQKFLMVPALGSVTIVEWEEPLFIGKMCKMTATVPHLISKTLLAIDHAMMEVFVKKLDPVQL